MNARVMYPYLPSLILSTTPQLDKWFYPCPRVSGLSLTTPTTTTTITTLTISPPPTTTTLLTVANKSASILPNVNEMV
ncbi:hypothetical protein E2C01_101211 [Portunus trituberculatus]|uniref:Uncharacterized protein n=1 Tax=Portunus trituberculatus TaxID=210409 RepID=A0A5B7KLD6_PORTR|nr:hypothetical protein [Portunus trituberculatus]